MHKFQTAANTTQPLTREEIVEALLVEAGAADSLPTDEARLLGFLKLEQLSFDFMNELDFLPKQEESALDLRAVLSLNDRIIATHSGLHDKRKRFGIFHEVAHFILPEHRDRLFLDNDVTLSWWTRIRIEREANEIAAEILFQGNRFTEEALSSPTSVRTVIDLAPKFSASYESAIRRYVERHVLPCAVIVYDKAGQNQHEDAEIEDTEYKIHYTVTSPAFRQQFFSGLEIKSGTIRASELGQKQGWWGNQITQQALTVGRDKGSAWHFETEIFNNGYKIFQFVSPPTKGN